MQPWEKSIRRPFPVLWRGRRVSHALLLVDLNNPDTLPPRSCFARLSKSGSASSGLHASRSIWPGWTPAGRSLIDCWNAGTEIIERGHLQTARLVGEDAARHRQQRQSESRPGAWERGTLPPTVVMVHTTSVARSMEDMIAHRVEVYRRAPDHALITRCGQLEQSNNIADIPF